MLLGWWVLDLTNSPSILGLVTSLNMLPFVFGIVSGIVVDRFNRRNILIFAESLELASSLPIALTVLFGAFHFWQLPLVSFLSGCAFTFGFSARAALLPDLVGKSNVTKAMSMLMTFWNAGFILGPYTGGILLNSIGYSGCFMLLGAVFLIEIVLLLTIRSGVNKISEDRRKKSIVEDLHRGVEYIRGDQAVLAILLMSAFWNLFVTPFQTTLLPVIARNTLRIDAAGLGVLNGALGLGSLAGSLFLIALKDIKHEGWLAIISSGLVGVFLITLSMSTSFNVALILLALIGWVNAIINTMSQTPLLVHVADEQRGLVMGIRGEAIATMPLGSILMGFEADSINASFSLALNGTVFGLIMMCMCILAPRFRKLD